MENSVDPHHVEWLHGYYFEFLGQTQGFDAPKSFQKKHMKTAFVEFHWGILKRRVLEGHSEADDDWAIGHPLVFPLFMRVGGQWIDQMQIRVPIDDTTTWTLFYSLHHPEGGTWEHQERPVFYPFPYKDENGEFITDYVEGQDVMAWVSQGPIFDRSQEHLGRSDAGVALLRKMFKENMRKVANGEDPIAIIREDHEVIDLPCERDKFGAGTAFTDQWITGGSMRYSPLKEQLLVLHRDAAVAREKAKSGA
jgi:5,5'-dehydrodivanillate O-demethylase